MAGPEHGFVLSGDMYTTFDLPGAKDTEAEAINNGGDIVGIYLDAADRFHALSGHSGSNIRTVHASAAR